MEDVVLQTYKLSKFYRDVRAVDGIDLTVERGGVFGFLGPNGAGKTTTIAMALGLIHPSAGRIEVFGKPVTPQSNSPLKRVGSLVGSPGLIPHLSGRDNLRLLTRLHPEVSNARIEEVLNLVGIESAADRKFQGYSTGMKQRIGLAAALLHRPDLLILDEPTNGLDPAGMREMRELLRSLAEQGVTVFLSSHLLHEIEQVCDHVAVLNHGKIVGQGSVADLLGGEKVVKVCVPSPQEAGALLKSLPGATDIQPNGTCVQVKGVSSEAVVQHLVKGGIVPSEVTSGQDDLESVFFALTGEDA